MEFQISSAVVELTGSESLGFVRKMHPEWSRRGRAKRRLSEKTASIERLHEPVRSVLRDESGIASYKLLFSGR